MLKFVERVHAFLLLPELLKDGEMRIFMKYDIHFSIAAFIIYIVLLVSMRVQYNRELNTVKKLRNVIICLFATNLLDVVTAYTITYRAHVPVGINYFLNAAFFIFEALCLALFVIYIRFVIDPEKGRKNVFDNINLGILVIFAIICATSFLTRLIFYFDENNNYQHGILYNLPYALGLYFQVFALVRLTRNRKQFNKRQFYSVIGFFSISVLGSIIQFIIPGSVFVLYFALSVAAFIAMFGLETPDYIKLEKTLTKLRQSEENLKVAVERAEAADSAKSEFLANMSHEIRTPINAVLGMNELISRESEDKQILTYSENIKDAGQTLLSLINDILDFSKIEAGKMELIPVDYELSKLIKTVSNIIKVRCEEKGLTFNVEVNPNIPNVLNGDEVRIRQVLINLLNNAVKYTEKGRIDFTIDFEAVNDDINLIASVKDTGVGIKEKDIDALFESFKRVDLEKNRKREGTGLGLSITKSLVDMMDGSIEVKSTYGEGSVFKVVIPQIVVQKNPIGEYKDTDISEPKEKYQTMFKAPTAKILVVDDVKVNLMVFAGLLKNTEMKISMAISGAQCLEVIKNNKFDVIFLDHMMPEMDGVETMQKLKEDSSHCNQDTPVIMLTANAILGAKEQYIDSGFNDYLSKPVFPKDLEEMLIKYIPKEKIMMTAD